jgi:dUTP pyrophosphatase
MEELSMNSKKFMDVLGAGNMSQDVMDKFMQMLALPDEQFDILYPQMKRQLEDVFSSPEFQQSTITSLKIQGHGTIEEERASAYEVINEIKQDETLSANKKDLLITIIDGSVIQICNFIEAPRERIKVQIKKLNEDAIIPQYAHKTDAGCDVYAVEETVIKPHTTVLVKTGIAVAIPGGYEIQVRPRSGLSLKTNLRVANAPGTIDSDYRGEVCVIMSNIGNLTETIKKGDKIAQLIIAPVPMIEWNEVDELDDTERGEGGFGSTDKK